jgi:hypothetical protein
MKNVLLALALTMAVPTLAMASPGERGGGPNPSQMLQQAQQELGLSNDQTITKAPLGVLFCFLQP